MSTSDFHPSLTITAVSGTADETSAIRVRQLRVVHAPRAGRWAMSTVGRTPVEIRSISAEVGVLPRVHGSALFQREICQPEPKRLLGGAVVAEAEVEQDGLIERDSIFKVGVRDECGRPRFVQAFQNDAGEERLARAWAADKKEHAFFIA